jgi:hypothetical protein
MKLLKRYGEQIVCSQRKKTTGIRGESEIKIYIGVQAKSFYDGVHARPTIVYIEEPDQLS